MKDKLLIVVDYSNLLYRAYFSCVTAAEVRPWLPVIRALDMLRSCVWHCRKNGQPVEFIFCGDSVRKKLDRLKIDAEYKIDRPPLANLRFTIFRSVMNKVIEALGLEVVIVDGAEGDDVIATVVDKTCHKCPCVKKCDRCDCAMLRGYNTDVVIFSMDRDLNSLLMYNRCAIYRPPGRIYDRAAFEEEFGFSPKLYSVYKALVGDRSDGLKGVSGWGPAKAKAHVLAGDWVDVLSKDNELHKFTHYHNLIKLNHEVMGVPCEGDSPRVTESKALTLKTQKEYKNPNSLDDILFMMKRLEESCKESDG